MECDGLGAFPVLQMQFPRNPAGRDRFLCAAQVNHQLLSSREGENRENQAFVYWNMSVIGIVPMSRMFTKNIANCWSSPKLRSQSLHLHYSLGRIGQIVKSPANGSSSTARPTDASGWVRKKRGDIQYAFAPKWFICWRGGQAALGHIRPTSTTGFREQWCRAFATSLSLSLSLSPLCLSLSVLSLLPLSTDFAAGVIK